MSRHAIDWVWKQDIKPATLKLLMLSIADRADEDNCAFPSIARLVKDTGLNNKTAQAGVNKLIEQGYVVDTGKRRGPTMRVRVLKILMLSVSEMEAQPSILNPPKNGHISQDTPPQSPDCKASNDPKNGNIPENGNIPDNGVLNDPDNGVLNDPKNGVLNDPENGVQNHPLEPPIEPLKKMAPRRFEWVSHCLVPRPLGWQSYKSS
jgi:DNA replication protein DnaT